MVHVWESQIGVEKSCCYCCGTLTFRALLEGQVWHEAARDPGEADSGYSSVDGEQQRDR